MKGLLLAGGSGTRLHPLTRSISKQLLPVYDKPTLFYPLSVLMLAGLREIGIVSSPRDVLMIEGLLGDGSQLGLELTYLVQEQPLGIAHALIVAEAFLAGQPCSLILGDNIFYGHNFVQVVSQVIERVTSAPRGAEVFAYRVQDPQRFGVVELGAGGGARSLEEKPSKPRSSWAVPGLYVYPSDAVARCKRLQPSARGELEITDLNRQYLADGQLFVHPLGRGVAWLDTGTYDSLLAASIFVQTLEQRQGLKVACLEEIAFVRGFIDEAQLARLAASYGDSVYGDYLRHLVTGT